MNEVANSKGPLQNLDDWEDAVEARYPQPGQKAKDDYRNYSSPARDTVREFYRLNHRHQTYEFVVERKASFLALNRRQMTVLEAMEYLNTLVDDSDPDIDLSQRDHLLQTSEAIRADGHDDWFVLTGLIHDLGKILCLFGEPQWAVVGDTFPVGCAFSPRIVYPEFLRDNPDDADPRFNSPCGVYEAGCGLRNVHLCERPPNRILRGVLDSGRIPGNDEPGDGHGTRVWRAGCGEGTVQLPLAPAEKRGARRDHGRQQQQEPQAEPPGPPLAA